MEQSMGDSKVREGNCKCALCEGEARMYCESDDAMLCWDCDARVHGANFLVARHTRAVLCRSCRSPTTWIASGSRLTPTISQCLRCYFGGDGGSNDHGIIQGDIRPLEDGEEDEEDQNGNKEEEDSTDNQVVPWGMPVAVTITPPAASSSSSEGSTLKRTQNDPAEQSSSQRKDDEAEPTSSPVQRMKFDRIKRIVGGDKGVSKARRHLRLRRERNKSTALSHTSVSAAGRRKKPAFLPTAVAGEPSTSCSSAQRAISPPKFIPC